MSPIVSAGKTGLRSLLYSGWCLLRLGLHGKSSVVVGGMGGFRSLTLGLESTGSVVRTDGCRRSLRLGLDGNPLE